MKIGDPTELEYTGRKACVDGQRLRIYKGDKCHSFSYDNEYVKMGNEPVAFSGHDILIDVRVKTHNYHRSGFSGQEIMKGGSIEIYADKIKVYEEFTREINHGLLTAHQLVQELRDLPIPWLDKKGREELIGSRVYYYGKPAIVASIITDQGDVILKADGCMFSLSPWRGDEERVELSPDSYRIKEDVLSPHIWWFRDAPTSESEPEVEATKVTVTNWQYDPVAAPAITVNKEDFPRTCLSDLVDASAPSEEEMDKYYSDASSINATFGGSETVKSQPIKIREPRIIDSLRVLRLASFTKDRLSYLHFVSILIDGYPIEDAIEVVKTCYSVSYNGYLLLVIDGLENCLAVNPEGVIEVVGTSKECLLWMYTTKTNRS